MRDRFEARFHEALTGLVEARALAPDAVRRTAVNTLVDLVLDSARIGERALPAHFSELMQALLPHVTAQTRRDVARRLAHCDLVPRQVARLLADEASAIALPILRQSPVLTEDDLLDIAVGNSDDKARAIAGRADLTVDVMTALLDRGDSTIAAALALAPSASLDPAVAERIACTPGLPRSAACRLVQVSGLSDAALAHLFLSADSAARHTILKRLGERRSGLRSPGRADLDPGEAERFGRTLFALAAAGETAALAERLEAALGLPPALARRIVADPDGEALTVAARAAGLQLERITGIVLLAVPEAGRSYAALKSLVALAETLDPATARRLVALWRRAAGPASPAPRREPAIARPPVRARGAATAPRRLEDIIAEAMQRRGSPQRSKG